jgi:hypothetical protein
VRKLNANVYKKRVKRADSSWSTIKYLQTNKNMFRFSRLEQSPNIISSLASVIISTETFEFQVS